MQRNIRVLVVEPEKEPYEKIIPNTLKAKQDVVGGQIEYTRADGDYYARLIVNEEGKIFDLPKNREYGYDDIIHGTFLVVGDGPDAEDDISLTDEQIEKYKKRFDMDSINIMKAVYINKLFKQKHIENEKDKDYEL